MTHQQSIILPTSGHGDMHDITASVEQIVHDSGIKTGIANIFNVGSTAVIGTIEYEPGLQADLPSALDKLIPPSDDYGHEDTWHDGNGHSHLQASILGPAITVPISAGKIVLGTWQQIFHMECDIKPHSRKIIVTLMGE
jgi:secondary thiamine-phosphate synthase enzyme